MSLRLDSDGPPALLDRPGLRRVLAALAENGEETRLVGGCIRDALLGRPVTDIDLATTLRPSATLALAVAAGLRAIPTGIEHGTVTILADGEPIEVTTLREDIETDGRHAVVRFGRDFAADAERRDFTINALSLGTDGKLHDTRGGIADLEAGRVRFIGDAATRIREDALRILRFFRFHARYGVGAPDAAGLAACIAARHALDGLSRERVRAEFLKLLVAPGAAHAVAVLSETGLLPRILGGIGDLGRMARAGSLGDRDAQAAGLHRLAALAVFSGEDAARLRVALRLSRDEAALLQAYGAAVAALHGHARIALGDIRRLAATHDTAGLTLALAVVAGEPRPQLTQDAALYAARLRDGALTSPVFPLTGADLVARGIAPGREIGVRLAVAKSIWLAEDCPEGDGARDSLIAQALQATV